MKDKLLQNLLAHLAEEAIPSTEVDLWPGIRARISEITLSRDSRMYPRFQGRRIAVSIVIAILLLTTTLLLTPQGHSLAQRALRFFTPAQVTSFPIAPTDTPLVEPSPTKKQGGTTPTTPMPENTSLSVPTPFKSGMYTTVKAAETSMGIDIYEFPFPLPGLELEQVVVGSDWIASQYQAIGGGGYLTLEQRLVDFSDSVWQSVAQEDVEIVMIGNMEGEYIEGQFTSQDEQIANWNQNTPVSRLRWQDGDWVFELRKEGDPVPMEYLNRDNLIMLALSLTDSSIPLRIQSGTLVFSSVANAEISTGLQIFEPAYLPELARVTDVVISMPQQWVSLVYYFGLNASLRISQVPAGDLGVLDLRAEVPDLVVENVQVGSCSGWYGVDKSSFKVLWWASDQHAFAIYFQSNSVAAIQLEQTDLMAIAESMQ